MGFPKKESVISPDLHKVLNIITQASKLFDFLNINVNLFEDKHSDDYTFQ